MANCWSPAQRLGDRRVDADAGVRALGSVRFAATPIRSRRPLGAGGGTAGQLAASCATPPDSVALGGGPFAARRWRRHQRPIGALAHRMLLPDAPTDEVRASLHAYFEPSGRSTHRA